MKPRENGDYWEDLVCFWGNVKWVTLAAVVDVLPAWLAFVFEPRHSSLPPGLPLIWTALVLGFCQGLLLRSVCLPVLGWLIVAFWISGAVGIPRPPFDMLLFVIAPAVIGLAAHRGKQIRNDRRVLHAVAALGIGVVLTAVYAWWEPLCTLAAWFAVR